MSESDLQRACEDLATLYGYLWFHDRDSRRNQGGLPDLILVHPHTGAVLWRELKAEGGRFRLAQIAWLDALRKRQDAGVWRPTDLHSGRIKQELAKGAGRG